MSFYCANCGSPNHRADVCTKPANPVEVAKMASLAQEEAKTSPRPDSARRIATVEEPVLLEPRWRGGPPICSKENLPAFVAPEFAAAYRDKWVGVCAVTRQWLCEHCKHWHFTAHLPQPAGTTSGTERTNSLPRNFKPFIRQSMRDMTARIEDSQAREREMELPKREHPESAKAKAPAAKKPEPRPKKKTIEGGLF